jgi:phage gp29-like protein
MATLLDQFGREIVVTKRPEMREIAVTTIRDRWSSYPSSGLTPQKLATIFKEADAGDIYRQAELFEEMEEKDTHLFSELQTRKNAVHGLDYDITPWSESAEDKRIRDFVADCIFNLETFDDALLDFLDAIGKGYSLGEILWATDGGKAVVGGLTWIHAKKAVFYERGGANMWAKSVEIPKIMTEAEPAYGETMPPWKLVYHRYKARSGYDTRAGILRVCAWMYLFKNYALKDWVAFAEVFGMPLRIGKYDPGAGKEDKDALVAAIRSLGSDAAGIISKNTEIEFVEAAQKGGGTQILYEALANFCDKQTSKAILGQTATTEGTPGKLGNEDAQDKVRHDLIKADSESLAKTVRFQLLRPLVGYNFGWDKPLPWFKLLFEPPEDLKSLSDVYVNLSSINFPLTAKHVSERFKVPLPEKGEEILSPAQNPGAVALKNTRSSRRKASRIDDLPFGRVVGALSGSIDPGPDLADLLADKTARAAITVTDGLMDPIRELVERATSLEEIRNGILALYADLNPEDLGVLIARAMTLAHLAGRAEVLDEA